MPVPLKLLAAQAMLDQDRRKRDDWLRRMKASKTGSQIMVGEDITLADVVKWLVEAVEAK
jgi:hypothetical protein